MLKRKQQFQTRKLDLAPENITSMSNARGEKFYRAMKVESFDDDKRAVELSFSSDAEIERWGDIEILDHSAGACVLDRLNGGASLLFNHDFDKPIGVVESARIDSDGKGRAVVRFGNGDFASEKWQDVKDGILRSVSVGYRVRELELTEKRDKGQHVYTVRKWEPYEISIVTVPVDTSVGVSRSENHNSQPDKKTIIMTPAEMKAALIARGIIAPDGASDEAVKQLFIENLGTRSEPSTPAPRITTGAEDRNAGAQIERDRVRSIMEIGRKYKMPEIAERAVEEGKSLDEFNILALAEYDSRSRGMKESHNGLGLSEKEVQDFSMVRLIRSISDPQDKHLREKAAYELEVCTAAAERSHKDVKGILIPSDILRAPMVGERATNTVSIKGPTTGYTGTGANVVQTQLLSSSFIDLLRNRTTILRRATLLTGLTGNIDIPKQVKGTAGYWIGEDDAAPKDDVTFGMIGLRPHTVANLAEITRRMLMQSSIDVEALVRADLANGIAQAIDLAAYYGDGSSNAPVGIKATAGITIQEFAGATPTFPELVAMETAIATANADYGQNAYMSNPAFRGYAKTTQRFTGGGDTGTIWEPGGTVNGYGTEITNQIAEGDVFYGNFADFIIGMWGGLEITVDPYTHSDKGRIRLVCMQDVDFEARRPVSFVYGYKQTA